MQRTPGPPERSALRVHFDPLKVPRRAGRCATVPSHETAVIAAPGSTLLGPDHFFPFQV